MGGGENHPGSASVDEGEGIWVSVSVSVNWIDEGDDWVGRESAMVRVERVLETVEVRDLEGEGEGVLQARKDMVCILETVGGFSVLGGKTAGWRILYS